MKKIFAFGLLLTGKTFAQAGGQNTTQAPDGPTPPGVSNAGGLLPGPKSAANDEGISFVRDTLGPALTNGYLWIILAIATFMFVIAGVMYILSNGDEEMVKKAKDTMTWTVVGTVAAILSLALVKLIVGINFGG